MHRSIRKRSDMKAPPELNHTPPCLSGGGRDGWMETCVLLLFTPSSSSQSDLQEIQLLTITMIF